MTVPPGVGGNRRPLGGDGHGGGEGMKRNPLIRLTLQSSHRCPFQPTVIVPHAHWEAYGRGSLHCITWFQTQLILSTCQIRYHNQCGIIVALDSSEP